jgi:hypothetical protein
VHRTALHCTALHCGLGQHSYIGFTVTAFSPSALSTVSTVTYDLHAVEHEVVSLPETLQEVVDLLPLDAAVVVIALAEPKVNLWEEKSMANAK